MSSDECRDYGLRALRKSVMTGAGTGKKRLSQRRGGAQADVDPSEQALVHKDWRSVWRFMRAKLAVDGVGVVRLYCITAVPSYYVVGGALTGVLWAGRCPV